MAKQKQISVIGSSGYVGRGMVALFKRRFEVHAVDKRYADGVEVSQVNFDNMVWGLRHSSLIVICVPTPMRADGACDTSIVEEALSYCATLGKLILIKSTVPPGFTESMNRRYYRSHQGFIHFSPEYMGEPSNYVAPWRTPDPADAASHSWVTVGGPQADKVLDFFTACMANDAVYRVTDSTSAELAKYMENTYFAMKVTFCNEIARMCRAIGASYKEVRELWLLDPRMHADHTVVFPDAPYFDGKCLPKDLAALIAAANARGVELPLLQAVQNTNNSIRKENGEA